MNNTGDGRHDRAPRPGQDLHLTVGPGGTGQDQRISTIYNPSLLTLLNDRPHYTTDLVSY